MKRIEYRDGYWHVRLLNDVQDVRSPGHAFWLTAFWLSLIPGYPAFSAR